MTEPRGLRYEVAPVISLNKNYSKEPLPVNRRERFLYRTLRYFVLNFSALRKEAESGCGVRCMTGLKRRVHRGRYRL